MYRYLILLTGVMVLVSGLAGKALGETDLDVTLIERTPRYDYDATKNTPAVNDVVTFSAHIKNWSDSTISSVEYVWEVDGNTVGGGTETNLTSGEDRVVTRNWTWQSGDHTVKFTADPNDLISESSEANNEIEDRINGVIVGFWVEQSLYDFFHDYQKNLGIGSNSWEDWAQRQVAKDNELRANAIWDISPNGILDRVRLDKIVVVSDGALPLSWGLPTNHPDACDKTVDMMWGFPATLVDDYDDTNTVSENNPFYIAKGLLHELGHARYLIDTYGFDVHNNKDHHAVQLWEGETYIAGSTWMPFLAYNEVLYYNESGGVMSGPYGFQWSPYEAGALNLIAGERATCGNYNSPCNMGEYLQDLPENNYLEFVDSNGQPRAGANVRIFEADAHAGWYAKTYVGSHDQEYGTDANGYIGLPRNPFNPGGDIIHGYNHANSTILTRIQHGEAVWYEFVEASIFNMAYWDGNTTDAYYTMELDGNNVPFGHGSVRIDEEHCSDDFTLHVRVLDSDLTGNGTQSVTLDTTGGDSESLVLTETGTSTHMFEGTIDTNSGTVTQSNGYLEVTEGETITVYYTDANDGEGGTDVARTDTVAVDLSDGVADSDISVAGTVSGSYSDTWDFNDATESITEVESGGAPANRYSYLEHKWTVDVNGGDTVTFYVNARRPNNAEGDDFIFAYSTNDTSYTDMVTISSDDSDSSYQSYSLPSGTSGTVYIRVTDTDRTAGNKMLNTVFIDHMFIRSFDEGDGATVLFSNGFESGDFTTGGWSPSNSDASVAAQAAYTGSYGAKLLKSTWIDKAVSTVGYSNIRVRYAWKTNGLDTGESLMFRWTDGGPIYNPDWTQVTSWAEREVELPSSADDNPDFAIRFQIVADKNNEYGYVDDVEVIGEAN